jgi:hypothetical protein
LREEYKSSSRENLIDWKKYGLLQLDKLDRHKLLSDYLLGLSFNKTNEVYGDYYQG